MLSNLNQKPQIRIPCQSCQDRQENGRNGVATKLFNGDAFMIPQNDVDAMLRVNMWNPVVSSVHMNRDTGGPNYRSYMNQQPFRRGFQDMSRPLPIQNDLDKTTYPGEPVDFFNPIKKIRLSITRLDNAVSFCRTHVQNIKTTNGRRETRKSHSASSSKASRASKDDNSEDTYDNSDQYAMKMKPPITDPFVERLIKPSRFEQKIMPLPNVKILDAVAAGNVCRETGSLSAKQGLLERSRRVEFDLPAKPCPNDSGNVPDTNKKDLVSVGIGGKQVAATESSKDLDLRTVEVGKVNTTTQKEQNETTANSKSNYNDIEVNNLNAKERKESIMETARETIKTIQGVKISFDNKKRNGESADHRKREVNSRHGQRAIRKAPVASGVGETLIIAHLCVPHPPSLLYL